jgi:hypothetical protein
MPITRGTGGTATVWSTVTRAVDHTADGVTGAVGAEWVGLAGGVGVACPQAVTVKMVAPTAAVAITVVQAGLFMVFSSAQTFMRSRPGLCARAG